MNKNIKKIIMFITLLVSLLMSAYSINLNITSPITDYKLHIYNIAENSENILLSLNNSANGFVNYLQLSNLRSNNSLIYEPKGDYVFGSSTLNGTSGEKDLKFKKYNESLTAGNYLCNPEYQSNNGNLSNFEININSNLVAPTVSKNGNPNYGIVDFSAVPQFESVLNNSYYANTQINITVQDNVSYGIKNISKNILLKDGTLNYDLGNLGFNENDSLLNISIDVIDGKCGVKTIENEVISTLAVATNIVDTQNISLSITSSITDYKLHIYNIAENSENILLSLNNSANGFVSSSQESRLTINNSLIYEPKGNYVFGSSTLNGISGEKDLKFKKYNESLTAGNYLCDPSGISITNDSLSNFKINVNSNLVAPTVSKNGNPNYGIVDFSAVPQFESILNSSYYANTNVKVEFKHNETNETQSISSNKLFKNGIENYSIGNTNLNENYKAQNVTVDVTDLTCGVKRIVYYNILNNTETYSNYTNVIETIVPPTTGSSGSGGGSGSSSKSIEQYLPNIKEKISVDIKKRTTLKLIVENKKKVFEIIFDKLNKDGSLKIRENRKSKSVNIGYTSSFDINDDGKNDYSISIKKTIDKNTIQYEIVNLNYIKPVVIKSNIEKKPIVEVEKTGNNESALIGGNVVKGGSFSWIWTFIIIIIIAIILIFIKYYLNNNKRKKLLLGKDISSLKNIRKEVKSKKTTDKNKVKPTTKKKRNFLKNKAFGSKTTTTTKIFKNGSKKIIKEELKK